MGIELFLHNQIAYAQAIRLMETHGKAAVIHPTGTGKSFIAFQLAEDHPDSRICWLAPSEYIYRTQLENLSHAQSGGERFPSDHVRFLTYARLMKETEPQLRELKPDYII